MPSHRGKLCLLALVILLVLEFVFEILLVVAVWAEVLLLQNEETMAEFACLEIHKPLRIECKALISCFKMKMRSGRASGRTSETYNISSVHPVTHLNHSLGKMTMESLDAVLMTDNHNVSISAKILGHSDLSRECGIDRIAGLQRYIYTLMTASPARTEFSTRMNIALERTFVLIQAIHKPY